MARPLTASEARKAMKWGLRQLGLHAWIKRAKLQWTDDTPEWVSHTGGCEGGGSAAFSRSHRTLTIWVGPTYCKADEDSDPLEVLFHEVLHVAVKVAGMEDQHNSLEFFINRQAECMAFAYRRGMKPWR